MPAMTRAAAIALILSGCTTQMTSTVPRSAADSRSPVSGVSYRLARLDYSAAITRTLTSCPGPGKVLEIEVAAAVTPTYAPAEEFVIDYSTLANGWKTTNISFETYPNGVLKSVNAQVADQTGPAIKAGVESLVGIAKLVVGVPGLPVGAATGQLRGEGLRGALTCTSLARTYLTTFATTEQTRDAAASKRDIEKANLAAFDADHAGAPLAEAAKAARVILAKAARSADEAAKTAVEAHAKQRQLLSVHTDEPVPTDATGTKDLKPGPAVGALYAKLFEVNFTVDGKPDGSPSLPVPAALVFSDGSARGSAAQNALKALIDRSTVTSTLQPISRSSGTPNVATASACGADSKLSPCGVLYRSATPVRLQLCRYSEKLTPCDTRPAGDPLVLVRDERNGPQLGGLRSLPLKNGPGETNSLVAVFREDSTLWTVIYAKPTAAGVVALGSLGDVVNGFAQVDTFNRGRGLRRTSNKTILAKAKADLATAQAAAYDAEIKRREAEAKVEALDGASQEQDQ